MRGNWGVGADGIELIDLHYSGRCEFRCSRCGSTWQEYVPIETDADNRTCVRTDQHQPCAKCRELDVLADKLFERLVGPMAIRIAERLRS